MRLFNEDGQEVSIDEVLSLLPIWELLRVNRVEVIDKSGRSYVNWEKENKTSLSMQDDGRTLKIFID